MEFLSPPEVCDLCCSANIVYKRHKNKDGLARMIYKCETCGASVGCHPGTIHPVGRMADGLTRRSRMLAHDVFDQLWLKGFMSREQAYAWLGDQLGLPPDEQHFGMMNRELCERAEAVSREFLKSRTSVDERRQAKKAKQRDRQREREVRKHIVRRYGHYQRKPFNP